MEFACAFCVSLGYEISSEWDDTVKNLVDNLLNLHETVDAESMPQPPVHVSLTVLEGGTALTYVPIQHELCRCTLTKLSLKVNYWKSVAEALAGVWRLLSGDSRLA